MDMEAMTFCFLVSFICLFDYLLLLQRILLIFSSILTL